MKDNRKVEMTELPWVISIEEFRKTGDFTNWSDEAIKSAIQTLAELTILAFDQKKSNTKLN
jgi:glucokinase